MIDWAAAKESDLQDLTAINQQEDHYLDFKAREEILPPSTKKSRREEVGKTISSFAHADGGTVIYGMDEDHATGAALRPRGFVLSELTKEQLTQIIQTSTRPPVANVRVYPIELSGQPTSYSYVVSISQSDTIHMALDDKFHRRDNATTRTMQTDELHDILNRGRGPKLTLSISRALTRARVEDGRERLKVHCRIACGNTGKIALHALLRVYVRDDNAVEFEVNFADASKGTGFVRVEPASGLEFRADTWIMTESRNAPIFPGEHRIIGTIGVDAGSESLMIAPRRVYWECIAPDMVTAHGGVVIDGTSGHIQVVEVSADKADAFFSS
jgi:Putative DNA-binding domain